MNKSLSKTEQIKGAKNFDELLDIHYGKIGEPKRDEFERMAEKFVKAQKFKFKV